MDQPRKRIVVGISGASGIIYGVRVLDALRTSGVETHLVMSRSAKITLAHELSLKVHDIHERADHVYAAEDISARISSGSFLTAGMIIAPCSMRTLGEIATSTTTTLL